MSVYPRRRRGRSGACSSIGVVFPLLAVECYSIISLSPDKSGLPSGVALGFFVGSPGTPKGKAEPVATFLPSERETGKSAAANE